MKFGKTRSILPNMGAGKRASKSSIRITQSLRVSESFHQHLYYILSRRDFASHILFNSFVLVVIFIRAFLHGEKISIFIRKLYQNEVENQNKKQIRHKMKLERFYSYSAWAFFRTACGWEWRWGQGQKCLATLKSTKSMLEIYYLKISKSKINVLNCCGDMNAKLFF